MFPPEPSTLKINTNDGYFRDPWISSFGGVIRNHHGNWIQGFLGCYGFMSNIIVELIAIHQLSISLLLSLVAFSPWYAN